MKTFREWSKDKAARTFEVESMRSATERVKGLWHDMAMNREARIETFAEACARLNVDEAKLRQIEAVLLSKHRASLFMEFAGFFSLVLGILNVNLNMAFMSLGTIIISMTFSFQSCFRIWQIRTRRLGSVGDFFREGMFSMIFVPFP